MENKSIVDIINEIEYIKLKSNEELSYNLSRCIKTYLKHNSYLGLVKFENEEIITSKSLYSIYRIINDIMNNLRFNGNKNFVNEIFNTEKIIEDATSLFEELTRVIYLHYREDKEKYLKGNIDNEQ